MFIWKGFPGGDDRKEYAYNAGDLGSIPRLGRQPTPVFWPGEFHRRGVWRATVHGDHKESDTTK